MHFYTDVCFILIMVSDACNELKRTLADGNAISAVKRFTKKISIYAKGGCRNTAVFFVGSNAILDIVEIKVKFLNYF